jgi:enamine deaminase RidA (YjgF/YER057c/UK114 family)
MVEFYVPPGTEKSVARYHMSQAVRVGNRIEMSGQGGWCGDWEYPESLTEQISNAFDNIERLLKAAGASWGNVIEVMSYHVPSGRDSIGDDHLEAVVDQMRKRMPDRQPIWTCVGVQVLGDSRMHVEIRVTAIID